jgi:hypothetical protein
MFQEKHIEVRYTFKYLANPQDAIDKVDRFLNGKIYYLMWLLFGCQLSDMHGFQQSQYTADVRQECFNLDLKSAISIVTRA